MGNSATEASDGIKWGPSGRVVYNRTYSRPKPNGRHEEWRETVNRVVKGNVNLVPERYWTQDEARDLTDLIKNFQIIPAGRQLWASGVKGRQFLFNCHVAGWPEKASDHFEFTFMRLAEGGGVGANYSEDLVNKYGPLQNSPVVHIVCDPMHRDYGAMEEAGLLSDFFSPDYQGAYFEVEDSREGWAAALVDLIDAAYDPNASKVRVYDVSRVRCKGSRIKTLGGTASGPQPLAEMLLEVASVLQRVYLTYPYRLRGLDAMEIDHAIGRCVVSGGNRRSARMSMMNWLDPDIIKFIRCKEDKSKHWTTNISVEVDEAFFRALDDPDDYNHERATEILSMVAEGMLRDGEPGLWNAALSNVGELNRIRVTNPCGEIPLEEWEACNLGHINLQSFVVDGAFDYEAAADAARLMTRFLIRSTYGDINDSKQREIQDRNRRIGVGFFGYAGMCAKLGIRYSKSWESSVVAQILRYLRLVVDRTASEYAHELRIPKPIKTTTVAPTGTIAKLPGATEGAHPIYARYFLRRIRLSTIKPEEMAQFNELVAQGYEWEEAINEPNTLIIVIPTKEQLVEEVEALGIDPEIVESVDEIDLEDLFAVQAMIQDVWADNAVSFTANIEPGKYSQEALSGILRDFLPRLKGTTVFPDFGRPQAPYERITKAEYEALTGPKAVADSVDEECATGACPIR